MPLIGSFHTPVHRLRVIPVLCLAGFLALASGVWCAQPARRPFDLPGGTADVTLRKFSQQAGQQIMFASEIAEGVRTNPVKGEFTPLEAAHRMLTGTALYVVEDENAGVLSVARVPAEDQAKNGQRAAPTPSDRPRQIPVANRSSSETDLRDEVIRLSPFEVAEDNSRGYYASNTMSGTRLNTRIEDLASSITVVTKEQMADFAMLDVNDIFLYEAGTEGSGTFTDFSIDRNGSAQDNNSFDPNNANRMRGIGPANVSLGNFETSGRVPIDPISIDAVEISRGPNSSVFGLGNASGTINMVPASANVQRNRSTLSFRADSYGGYRSSIDLNRVLKKGVLAVRVSAVDQHDGFVRKPSGTDTERLNGMVRYQPFKYTTLTASHSYYRSAGTRTNAIMPRDGISGWLKAGSPTWDPVTATAKINGVPVPGTWTANALPAYFMNAHFLPRSTLFVDGEGAVGFWSASRTTSAATPNTGNQNVFLVSTLPEPIRATQPLYAGDLSVTSKEVYDYTSINLGALNSYSERALTSQVNLEQIFLNTPRHLLAAQAGWFREDSRREFVERGGRPGSNGVTGVLYIDPNERMIDGSPNPYFLQPFLGYFRLNWDRDLPSIRQTSRLQAVYRLDLRQEKSFLRWLGMAQISAYGEYKQIRSRETIYQNLLMPGPSWLPLPTTTTRITAPPAVVLIRELYERFYVGDASGQNVDFAPSLYSTGIYPYRWGNGVTGSFVTEQANLGRTYNRTNGYRKDLLRNKGVVLQNYLLKDRIVTTFGYRRDYTTEQQPDGRIYINGPDGLSVDESTLNTLSPVKTFNQGDTKTAGIVVKPTRWLNLHYNQSDSFRPESQVFLDLHLQRLPNPSGEGKDYGFSLNLFDGKLVARVNKYSTLQLDSRDGNARAYAQRVRQLDFNTANSPFSLDLVASAWVLNAAARDGITLSQSQVNQQVAAIMKIDVAYLDYFDTENPTAAVNNISAVADVESRGIEFELNYNPSRFWTLKFNATKTESIDRNISADIERWISERLPAWQSIIDPELNRPWFTERYGGTTSAKEHLEANVLAPLAVTRANEGKSRPQIRKYRFNLSTSYRLAGVSDNRWLKAMTVGGALRWEDKAAIGYYGVETPPAIVTALDPNRPIWEKARAYGDLFVAYRTRLFADKVNATFQLNVRNIQENGRLQAISAYPDGTPTSFRIVDPRQFILTATFEL